MAAIDKIYGTKDQCVQLYKWVKKHRPKALRCVYNPEFLVGYADREEWPIANFPVSVDAWLARKCNLPFVLEAIGEQYVTRKIGQIARARLTQGGMI